MFIKNKYKIIYCSNIFREDSWKSLFLKLNDYVIFLNEKNIELSLCLSSRLASGFLKEKYYFKYWLKKNNVSISSLNGFVYTKFHKNIIKDDIYYPDWTAEKRFKYTSKLVVILDGLLPNHKIGSISTLPLSYMPWIKKKHFDYVFYKSSKNLIRMYPILFRFKKKKKFIHIDIEPEPTCFINSVENFIKYFNNWLIPIAKKIFSERYFFEYGKTISILRKYFRLCYDISHSSVNFDIHSDNLFYLKKNKIRIGKVQISSAIEFLITDRNKQTLIKKMKKMKKSPFLHQVIEKKDNKKIVYKDLPIAIENIKNKNNVNLRIHFHMPIFKKKNTTQYDIKNALLILLKDKNIKHFEIETYTFSLSSKRKQFSFMKKEYNWLKNLIKNIYV